MTDILNLARKIDIPTITAKYWQGWEKERLKPVQKKIQHFEED